MIAGLAQLTTTLFCNLVTFLIIWNYMIRPYLILAYALIGPSN